MWLNFYQLQKALDANQRRLYFKRLCHGITPMAEPFLIAFKKIVHVISENNFYKSMEFISKRGIVKAFTNERGYKNETYSSTTS